MKRLLSVAACSLAIAGATAAGATATASVFETPIQGTLVCGSETVQASGFFRVVAAQSPGSTILHVTAQDITAVGSSGTLYRLVGAGADIDAGLGADAITSFHHGTLVGGTGQPIHPLMYVVHATFTSNGQVSAVDVNVSDCA